MRKTLRVMTFAVLAFFGAAGHVDAQEKIVVMSQRYSHQGVPKRERRRV